jgi:hypothetical protein
VLIARTSRDGRRGDGNVRDATAVDAEDDVPTRRPNARETAVNVAIVDADVIAVFAFSRARSRGRGSTRVVEWCRGSVADFEKSTDIVA